MSPEQTSSDQDTIFPILTQGFTVETTQRPFPRLPFSRLLPKHFLSKELSESDWTGTSTLGR